MKSKVHFSTYCTIITIAVLVLFVVGIVATRNESSKCLIFSIITALATLAGLYYCPVSVTADSKSVKIHRLLSGDKTFNYSDIESVDTFYPSPGALRLCGSGGFFGYWGYFSDIIIGQYFGYYADRSQSFCIKLKNNRQYVISCDNHIEMVKFIINNLK